MMKRALLPIVLLLLAAGVAPGAPALLGGNSRLGEKLLDAGSRHVASGLSAELQQGSDEVWLRRAAECSVAPAANPVQGLPRVGSALKTDPYHAFPNVVDNFASGATNTTLRSGATLHQIEGSLNGVAGRFEWIIENGQVTHRMFVPGGTINGVPIKP